jgi:hypothetical protein
MRSGLVGSGDHLLLIVLLSENEAGMRRLVGLAEVLCSELAASPEMTRGKYQWKPRIFPNRQACPLIGLIIQKEFENGGNVAASTVPVQRKRHIWPSPADLI